jgi:hypothetical protein
VEWEDTCTETQVERVVPVYNKTDVSGLQTFLRDKFAVWSSNVEEIWNNLKNIVYESLERFVFHETLRKNRAPNITTRRLND